MADNPELAKEFEGTLQKRVGYHTWPQPSLFVLLEVVALLRWATSGVEGSTLFTVTVVGYCLMRCTAAGQASESIEQHIGCRRPPHANTDGFAGYTWTDVCLACVRCHVAFACAVGTSAGG